MGGGEGEIGGLKALRLNGGGVKLGGSRALRWREFGCWFGANGV